MLALRASKYHNNCRLTRALNAETQLLVYMAWQLDRYLVPQNVFLVIVCTLSSSDVMNQTFIEMNVFKKDLAINCFVGYM